MKKSFSIICLSIIISFSGWGQGGSYKVGEKVFYSVQYGIITGGTSSLELTADTLNGKEVWHSKFIARTTGIADVIFKVLDIYESYIDPVTELPVKSIRNIREGRYRKYNEVQFDHNTRADSSILTSELTGNHITTKGIHDILKQKRGIDDYPKLTSIMVCNPDLAKTALDISKDMGTIFPCSFVVYEEDGKVKVSHASIMKLGVEAGLAPEDAMKELVEETSKRIKKVWEKI